MSAVNYKGIRQVLSSNFKEQEPMHKHCSFKTGGKADFVFYPENLDELKVLLKFINLKKIPYFVLGGGTNIIVKDSGIRGVVIFLDKFQKTLLQTQESENFIIEASSNVKTQSVVNYAIKLSLKGFNMMAGIPGEIGGAIASNASTSLGALSDIIKSVKVLNDDGKIEIQSKYRRGIILSAEFILKQGDKESLKDERKKLLIKRKETQPLKSLSAGCIFKNPLSGYPAGKMIDMLGLKNFRYGGAKVSPIHANFIVNNENAKTDDILYLIDEIKDKVKEEFGVNLQEEVKIIG